MLPLRRKAKMQAVDGLMKMLGNMDSQRMQAMNKSEESEDGSSELEDSAQLATKRDAHQVLQAKGSDSDINENALGQHKAAPPSSDMTDGDEDADYLSGAASQEANEWQPLRDAAENGDSTSRRILDLFAEEPENDETETDYDAVLEPEESASETANAPGEFEPEIDEEYRERDFERGEEDVPEGDDSTGEAGEGDETEYPAEMGLERSKAPGRQYPGGSDAGDSGDAGYTSMRVQKPRRRR